ncbi:MAG: hypothetical protein K8R21_08715 [Leptospira sp.]|nr:hypothetical protein [Leptospira sp.]
MPLTNVSIALRKHKQPVILHKRSSISENASGEVQFVWATPQNLEWPVTPISAKQLQVLPEGQYTSEDRNFYQIGEAIQVNANDEFEFNGKRYVVGMIKDLIFEAGVIRYSCKKKVSA